MFDASTEDQKRLTLPEFCTLMLLYLRANVPQTAFN